MYDPFTSLGSAFEETEARVGEFFPAAPSRRSYAGWATLARLLWAALESDLFRFAFDRAFTRALDAAAETPEWRRFARLNDLYRSLVKAIVPLGIAPPGWIAALRGEGTESEGSRARRLVEASLIHPRTLPSRIAKAAARSALRLAMIERLSFP